MQRFRMWDWIMNSLLVAAALFALLTHRAWGLDTQDIVTQWTEAGKKIAAERVANWKTKDEMVLVPSGLSRRNPAAACLSGRL